MELLTEKKIRDILKPFEEEFKRDKDWWYGSEEPHLNAFFGWDCNVYQKEDKNFYAVVYELKKEGSGFLITDNIVLKFKY